MKQVVEQQVQYDIDGCYLLTKFDDGSVLCEPITSEEAYEIKLNQGAYC